MWFYLFLCTIQKTPEKNLRGGGVISTTIQHAYVPLFSIVSFFQGLFTVGEPMLICYLYPNYPFNVCMNFKQTTVNNGHKQNVKHKETVSNHS